MAADADKIISLNVGGVKFATSLETLTRVRFIAQPRRILEHSTLHGHQFLPLKGPWGCADCVFQLA